MAGPVEPRTTHRPRPGPRIQLMRQPMPVPLSVRTAKRPRYRRFVCLLVAAGVLIGRALPAFSHQVTVGPQAIVQGSVKLAVGPADGAASGTTGVAPGDTISRQVHLNDPGRMLAKNDITLRFLAWPSSLLDRDATNGLQVGIQACSRPWKRNVVRSPSPTSRYTCTPGATIVNVGGAVSTSVGALERAPGTLTPLSSSNTDGKSFLLVTLTLPAAAPGDLGKVAACSGTPGGTAATEDLQGCSATLTYIIQATQRGPGSSRAWGSR